ncbi:MAG TPA: CPBP family intramembrane glutamic endopeptidase [Gemmataceae bacterium]|jgi:membrane protease YdiL (CAAX protease family)|nr:CPBP family intramembrane glutamic endopeptidase [Gemmataceae bacterium]
MSDESASSAVKNPARLPSASILPRAAALIEVVAAFALVHVTYRFFKRFTELGQAEVGTGLNFSPGAVMILFTVAVVWLRGRSFADYGLTLKDGRFSLNFGLIWGMLFTLAAALVIKLASIHFDPLHPPDLKKALFATSGELVNTCLLLWFLIRRRKVLFLTPLITLPILVFFLSIPLALALSFDKPFLHTALTVLWLFFGAGFGEEIFFRGFIQSRVNEAFGRPFRFLGVEFGWGLVVSATLFGCIHVLNTVDYFGGRYDFAWLWWPPNFAAGLFFGLLREKTRSILAGAIVHGLSDVSATVPEMLG